jgi:hypothetical protein
MTDTSLAPRREALLLIIVGLRSGSPKGREPKKENTGNDPLAIVVFLLARSKRKWAAYEQTSN